MTARERVIELIRKMQTQRVENGCTPAEAAAFAAKAAEWIEKYQIEEAELRQKEPEPERVEVCQEHYWTDKKVLNPGVTALISSLARAMSCKIILLNRHQDGLRQAGYGIVGDVIDAQFVLQMAQHLLPQLIMMAKDEGWENGYEKAALIRWQNQYLMGAGTAILERLIKDRNRRSQTQEQTAQAINGSGALVVVITGDKLAKVKEQAVAKEFKRLYPKTHTVNSQSQYDHSAYSSGQEAGKSVGLGLPIQK